jgi:hypothetical protein
MKGYFIPVVLSMVILLGCAQPSGEDELVYQRQSFWSQDEFSTIWANKTGFELDGF